MKKSLQHHHHDKEKLKNKEEIQEIQSIEEELMPLNLMNPKIKQISGLKGVYIQESSIISNLFSWNTEDVFAVYAADENGKIQNANSKPILYGIARSNSSCEKCDVKGLSEVAITTSLSSDESSEPYIYINKQDHCCSSSVFEIFINQKGNQKKIANVKRDLWKDYLIESEYVKELKLFSSVCQCYWTEKKYNIEDGESNKTTLIEHKNYCSCSNPANYSLGFPSKYNDDQKTILLSICIYKAFSNAKKRKSAS